MSSSLVKVPALGVAIGVAYFAAAAIAGSPGLGAVMFGIMFVFSAGMLLASRYSETVRGLLDHKDERISHIDLRASALTGLVLAMVIIGAAVVEIANGRSGEPFTWLGAVGGTAYVVSVVFLRARG